MDEWVIYSVGGGALANEETAKNPPANIYPMTHISEILEWCNREGQTFWEYVEECEGPGIWDYLDEIWTAMCETIVRGLTAEGVLPGGLKVSRKASTYLVKAESYTDTLRSRAKLYAYASPRPKRTLRAAPSSRLRPADRAPSCLRYSIIW